MKTSISFLKNNTTYEDTIKKINNTSSDYLHVDVMDGKFVPEKNFDPEDLTNLLKISTKPLDVHLMVVDPLPYIAVLKDFKPDFITIHLEIANLDASIKEIKKFTKVGLSIKPDTNLADLDPYLEEIDLVLVMGVNPGFGGQKMIPETIKRLKALKKLNKNFVISIDGGVNEDNISEIKNTNIDMVVSGSFVTMTTDFEKQISKLK